MTQTIRTIIFDLGNVLIGWDAHLLYDRLLPDPATVDSFLKQIRFMEWNAKQDAGRPFHEGVAELSKEFPQYADLIHRGSDGRWRVEGSARNAGGTSGGETGSGRWPVA